ncbi:hypothetical protein F4809DRAFT_657995 [Biscogniauxia mediterranea]|nr:hypothetical protein F4809DRAFT_657995 [Biscogniauxia mediterranea]
MHRLAHVPDPGWQGKLVDAICSALDSGCDYEDIVFNNALETEHCGAVDVGRKYNRSPRTMKNVPTRSSPSAATRRARAHNDASRLVLTNEFPPFRQEQEQQQQQQQQQQQKQQQKETLKTEIKKETPKAPAETPAPTQQYQELTVCYVCRDVTPLKGFPKHMMEAHFGLNCYVPGCFATFTTEADLKSHLEYHTAPEYVGPHLGYRCCWPNCPRTFNHRGEIRLHHLKHNVGEKIVCEMRARNITKAPVIRVPVPQGKPRKLELSYILNPVTEE